MTHIYILSFTTFHQIVLQCRYPRIIWIPPPAMRIPINLPSHYFGIARLLGIYQTYWCEIVSSCDFYFHFLVFQWVWESFMLCLLASWFFYFMNFLFISFVHFLFGLWLCVFSFSNKSLYILNDNSLWNLCTLNKFCYFFTFLVRLKFLNISII